MSEKTPLLDFERSWQSKLATGLDQHLEPIERDRVLTGGELLTMESSTKDKVIWSCGMLNRLEEVADEKARQDIMTGCACQYPKADLEDARDIYLKTGDVDQVINLLQANFEGFLRDILKLDEDLINELIHKGWGVAGVREGRKIISTKIPKSSYIVEYFEAEDPQEKRKLYCHCPRVRDSVGDNPQLPLEYCYCGAGFYKGIWETILQVPVQVEVLESVMMGGDVCKIAIPLPESISINKNT